MLTYISGKSIQLETGGKREAVLSLSQLWLVNNVLMSKLTLTSLTFRKDTQYYKLSYIFTLT